MILFFLNMAMSVISKPQKVSVDYLLKIGYSSYAPLKTEKNEVLDGTEEWSFIGPMPITGEGWSSNGNASGRLTAILIDEENNLLYIGGAQGGIWKSNDDGQHWEPLTDNISSLATGALTLDPSNHDILYYGTGEQHFSGDSYFGDGLFKSMDKGNTWEKIADKNIVGAYISRIYVDPDSGNIVHLTSDKGYLRSSDSGKTWEVKISEDWGTDLVINPLHPETLWAAIRGKGIYVSEDRGLNWTKLSGGLPLTGFRRINMAISLSNPAVIYASFIANDGSLYGMYKTINSGELWGKLTSTPNYVLNQGWYDNCIAVDPDNENICYAGGVYPYGSSNAGVIKTEDGGNTWQNITVGIDGIGIHPDQHFMAINSKGDLYIGNDGGIWKTEDKGQHWINLNDGLGITQFYTVDVHPNSSDTVLGGTQDNGTVMYKGNIAWEQVSGGDGGPTAFEYKTPNIFYTTYVFLSPLWKFVNGNYYGEVTGNWKDDRKGWADSPVVSDFNTEHTIYVGTEKVWKSSNSGGIWEIISNDLTQGTGYLSDIAVAKSDSRIIYTVSSDGKVHKTENAGLMWQDISSSHFGSNYITDVVVSPYNTDEVYLALKKSTGEKIFRTTDGGQTWDNITGNFPDNLRILSIECAFFTNDVKIFIGTDYGVYVSSDTGKTYSYMGTGLPSLAIYEMKFNPVDSVLTAATHGRGMWQVKINAPGGIANTKKKELKIVEGKDVVVFDIMGREKTVINDFNRGKMKILPAGIYFIKPLNTDKTVIKTYIVK